jgi:hypothetical protein
MNIEQGKSHWTGEELDLLRSTVRELMTATASARPTSAGVRRSRVHAEPVPERQVRRRPARDREEAVALDHRRHAKTQLVDRAAGADLHPHQDRRAGDRGPADRPGARRHRPGHRPARLGKTAAARQYQATTPRVAIATGSPAIATASAVLQQLIRSRGEMPRGRSGASKLELTTARPAAVRRGLADRHRRGPAPGTIEALEELRAIHDETGVGIVLMGNDTVLSRIEGNERSAAFAQLYSRAGVRVKLKGSPTRTSTRC